MPSTTNPCLLLALINKSTAIDHDHGSILSAPGEYVCTNPHHIRTYDFAESMANHLLYIMLPLGHPLFTALLNGESSTVSWSVGPKSKLSALRYIPSPIQYSGFKRTSTNIIPVTAAVVAATLADHFHIFDSLFVLSKLVEQTSILCKLDDMEIIILLFFDD